MNNSDSTSSTYFLNHPEIQQLLEDLFSTLIFESDRGAVLVGAFHIDSHLKKLFEEIAPRSMNRKRLEKDILSGLGQLSTFSAKTHVAYITRLIPKYVYDAINHLRDIRNKVAHSPHSFRLSDHEQKLRNMYELGPGVPAAINQTAARIILLSAAETALTVGDPTSDVATPIFNNPQEALAYLAEQPKIMAIFEERRPRYELAWGVGLICGLIVHHRERAKKVLGDNTVLSFLA